MDQVYQLDNFGIANGIAAAPWGTLLVTSYLPMSPANENLTGRVVEFTLDIDETGANVTGYDDAFLDENNNVLSPNGLRFAGNDLYITDLQNIGYINRLLRVNFDDSGTWQSTEVIAELAGLDNAFDDLTTFCTGWIIASLLGHNLQLVSPSGEIQTILQDVVEGPTSVMASQVPLYDGADNEIIITERGNMGGAEDSPFGNMVSLIYLSSDQNRFLCGD